MRKIKFRAWDKEGKKWLDISYLFFDSGGKVIGYTIKGDTHTIDKVELVEYTGLKDKNGKEIYEGDIVQLDERVGLIGQMVFHNGSFCFRQDRNHIMTTLGDWFQEKEREVIGNIYENPELFAK